MGYRTVLKPIEIAANINPSNIATGLGIIFTQAPLQRVSTKNNTPLTHHRKKKWHPKQRQIGNDARQKRLGKLGRLERREEWVVGSG
jgi:hypothetical protein